MKVKRISIGIKSLDEALKEAGETFTNLAEGKPVKKKRAIYFSNIKDFRKVLTDKRLELLKTVKDRKPSSVYALAKILKRDLKNVLQDIEYLKQAGLVEIEETENRKIPHVEYDRITLDLAV
jgi:predicted transcriptional regulator